MWKRNPSPACARGYLARHPPGEEQQWPCEQRAEPSALLQSPALPPRLLIKRKRRRFRSFPKKARSLLGSCASPGIFFIRGFSGVFNTAGSSRRDPGRISLLSDSHSHIMGIWVDFNILHFSTLIHATPGE